MSRINRDTKLFIYWLENNPQFAKRVGAIRTRYARTRGTLGLAPADAIHLACAAQAGTDLFVTNDKNLVGKIVPGIHFMRRWIRNSCDESVAELIEGGEVKARPKRLADQDRLPNSSAHRTAPANIETIAKQNRKE